MTDRPNPNLMSPVERAEYAAEHQALLDERGAEVTTGHGGSGKTHLLVQRSLTERVAAIVTPTHRAAHVLRQRFTEIAPGKERPPIGTLHSVLSEWLAVGDRWFFDRYRPTLGEALRVLEPDHGPLGHRSFPSKPIRTENAWLFGFWRDLGQIPGRIFADEASMIGRRINRQILELADRGQMAYSLDPQQLPPVGDRPFWIDIEPTTHLTTQWRQDGPLLQAATGVRMADTLDEARRALPCGQIPADFSEQVLAGEAAVIAWRNATVEAVNAFCRERFHYPANRPAPGEPVVCADTRPDLGRYNAEPLTIAEVTPSGLVRFKGAEKPVPVRLYLNPKLEVAKPIFRTPRGHGEPLAIVSGFGLTVHKAQGGQWPAVYVLDDSPSILSVERRKAAEAPPPGCPPQMILTPLETTRQWLYTACTRAERELVVTPAKTFEMQLASRRSAA